jgi:hypothetical protein
MFYSNKSNAVLWKGLIVCAVAGIANGEMAGEAHAGARITIAYVLIKSETAPQQKMIRFNVNRVYTLHGSQVDFSGTGLRDGGGMKLGDDLESRTGDGRQYKFTYRILNGVLFVVSDFKTYTSVRKIRTDGKNACSSTLEYKKKAGYSSFEEPELNATFSDIHAENVTCSITATAD